MVLAKTAPPNLARETRHSSADGSLAEFRTRQDLVCGACRFFESTRAVFASPCKVLSVAKSWPERGFHAGYHGNQGYAVRGLCSYLLRFVKVGRIEKRSSAANLGALLGAYFNPAIHKTSAGAALQQQFQSDPGTIKFSRTSCTQQSVQLPGFNHRASRRRSDWLQLVSPKPMSSQR
jgi:hypothetical protein